MRPWRNTGVSIPRAAAAAGGTAMPTIADPQNPYRHFSRISSPDEQITLNNEFAKESKEAAADCRGR
ncbi:MAG: hypothetical protein KGK03_10445 [Candidatus Omnitrophica bacterium]|nr:hypothetical protein [Candidatus Omnitrophota bacterium]